MAGTITIDVNDVYVLNYTGDQTDDFIGSTYFTWSGGTPTHGSIGGTVDTSTAPATLTGQRGHFYSNYLLGSVATLGYRVIP